MKADQAGLRRAIGFYQRAVSLDSAFAAGVEPALPRPDLALLERRAGSGAGRRGAGRGRAGACAQARRIRWSIWPPAISMGASTRSTTSGPWPSTDRGSASRRTTWTCSARWRWPRRAWAAGTASPARLARVSRLDPRSTTAARRLAAVHIFLRQYAAADSAADRALALAPTSPAMVSLKVMAAVGRGDLDSARAVIRAAARADRSRDALSLLRQLPGHVLGARRRAAAAGARRAAERVRRRPRELGPRPGRAVPAPRGSPSDGGVRRLRAARARGAEPGRARRRRSATRCSGSRWRIWGGRRTRSARGNAGWR